MANSFLTPQIIAVEALRLLTSNLVYRDLVHTDFSKEFQKVGDTVNVRKRNLIHSKNYLGNAITVQDVTETPVPVKLDRIRDTSVKVSSKDMTLSIKDFSTQVLEPIMLGMAQDIDSDIAAALLGWAGDAVSKTENPTNLADIAGLAKKLDAKKVPNTERSLVLCPDHKYAYALTDNLSKVSYAGDNETLREALLGKIYSLVTYMSQNNPDTSATTAGTATAYKVKMTAGSNTINITDGNAATGTIKKGDKFIVNGHLYEIANDITLSSGAASGTITEAAVETISNATSVVIVNKPTSVAFHKEAIAFVNRPMEVPMGAARAYTASADGFSVRVVIQYNNQTKEDVISVDCLYGIAELNKDMIVALK